MVAFNQSEDPTYGTVFEQVVPNNAPALPQPLFPLDFARSEVEFKYQPSTDVDGDFITYKIYLGEGENPVEFAEVQDGKTEDLVHGSAYSWYVEANDGHGGIVISEIVQFTCDTDIPVLTVEEPHRPYTNQEQLVLSTYDSLSGIERVTYKKIDADTNEIIAEGTLNLTPDSNEYNGYKSIIKLDEGSYHIHLISWDNAGNQAGYELNNLWVDHTPPQLTEITLDLPYVSSRYLCSMSKIPVTWAATDDFSGHNNMHYWIVENTTGELGTPRIIKLSCGLTQYTYSLDFSGINGRQYYFALCIEDNAGNKSDVHYVGPILLDFTPPVLDISLSGPGLKLYGASFYVTDLSSLNAIVNAEDEESGIIKTEYALLMPETGEIVNGWGDWASVKQTSLQNGIKYQVAVNVENGVGLEVESRSVEFIYDSTAPENLILAGPVSPLAGYEIGVFTVSAEDLDSPIVEYRLAIGKAQGEKGITALIPGNDNGWLIVRSNTSTTAQFRVELPPVENGTYYPTLMVVNAAGLKSTLNGNSFNVNNTQDKVIVGDQGPYTMFADHLTGWWRYVGNRSIEGYRYRITGKGNIIVNNWSVVTETMLTLFLIYHLNQANNIILKSRLFLQMEDFQVPALALELLLIQVSRLLMN